MDITFVPPPEAPVYEPTPEEFQDPITYIASIRPQAEKFGLCKIRPPSSWQPPFVVNAEAFKFVPRIQRLSELEAKSRIRLYFLNDLAKFWELQNNSLKRQVIENKTLDLYHLRKFVHEKEGFHKVTKNGKWKEIASMLGYSSNNEVANQIHKIYEKTLLPYDVVLSGATSNKDQKTNFSESEVDPIKPEVMEEEKKPEVITPPTSCDDDKSLDTSMNSSQLTMNSELKKLQFYGPGPRMAVVDFHELDAAAPKRTRPRNKAGKSANASGKACEVCGGSDGELGTLISCSSCPALYHHSCSVIGPKDGSKKPWRCHHCIVKECKKPMPSFGFEESKIEYSLKSFGKMADDFKTNHFNAPCHTVPCSVVEKEFWQLVNSLERDVVVEYGADIHTLSAGSGFPTERTRHLISEEDREYISSSWNLNNLPVLPGSLLKYINVEINGMKVPWVYVGMCFSSFAWHIEDHWNYSINYLHWGEPKTWYGVPGESAEQLEECMKKNAPELFEEFPDLLHHITTIMNPNVLMNSGVPIFRTDQHAGEFVVTFPRSYHSGFNQGYNFAEAVNFCTSDWLPFGHGCIENYRMLKRQCVFSNDEFICKIISEADDLTTECIVTLLEVFRVILDREEEVLKRINERGISAIIRKDFERLPDDERQCDCCYTTCFLSAVMCSCSRAKMVCPCHVDDFCGCPSSEKTFLFQYTMEELREMEKKLSSKLEGFECWCERAQKALEARGRFRLKLETMKTILDEARERNYPSCPLVDSFKAFIKKADRYFYIMRVLGSSRDIEEGQARPTYEELLKMLDDVDNLPCRIPFKTKLSEHVVAIQDYCDEIRAEVTKDPLDSDSIDLLFERGSKFNIDIPDISLLHQAMSKMSWLQEVSEMESETVQISWETVQRLFETGQKFPKCSTSAKKLKHLCQFIEGCQRLEVYVTSCLNKNPLKGLRDMEALLEECLRSKVVVPSTSILEAAIKDSKEWTQLTKELFRDHIELDCEDRYRPSLEESEAHLNRGKQLPVELPDASIISAKVCCAKTWVNTLSDMILKSKQDNLIDVLTPRMDIAFLLGNKGSTSEEVVVLDRNIKDINFNQEREKELSDMKQLRKANREKMQSSKKYDFCICLKGKSGQMIQCHLCCDLFHVSCVCYNVSQNTRDREAYDGFLCPRCARTKRAPFPALQVYVERYENDLDLRLSEADVLKDVIKRAEIWRGNVRKVFDSLHITFLLRAWEQGHDLKTLISIDLSDSSLEALDDLLTSGNLMEVFLPEKNLIKQILSSSKTYYQSNVVKFPSVLPDVVSMCQKTVSYKGKRSLDSCSRNGEGPPKKLKKSGESLPGSTKMSKSMNSSESDDRCSAEPCHNPEGDSLAWVQCDYCKKWFHFKCIGLQKIKKTEKFQCRHCSAKSLPVSSPLLLTIPEGSKVLYATKKVTVRRSLEKTPATQHSAVPRAPMTVVPLIRLNSLNGHRRAVTLPNPSFIIPGMRPSPSAPLIDPTNLIRPRVSENRVQEGVRIINVISGRQIIAEEGASGVTTSSINPKSSSAILPISQNPAHIQSSPNSDEVIVIDDD